MPLRSKVKLGAVYTNGIVPVSSSCGSAPARYKLLSSVHNPLFLTHNPPDGPALAWVVVNMPHHFSAAADEALRKGEPETAWVLSSGLIGNANLLGQGSLISTPRDTANVIGDPQFGRRRSLRIIGPWPMPSLISP
ncbi:hypothetical protein SCAR479_09385 [Seiridium cardinale]|uniref:Uncharacterized protein n=1 Tax=Seiridium cardinale TaxID=138064 RepID=A0ABR2XIZ1_9PEZI